VPEVYESLDALLDGATSREPLDRTDGKSGATLERVVVGGTPYVLKHYDAATDWLLRATGDAGCRAVALWELGLYDAMPYCIDHTVVGAAREPDRGPWAAALLMRDVGEWLVPEGDGMLDLATHHRFLDHLAEQHAALWGWRDTYGLLPMGTRYQILTPEMAAYEASRGSTDEIPRYVAYGWRRLDEVAPSLAPAMRGLVRDPAPLVDALAATPATFLQGDWKLGNMGAGPDGRTILLDWDRPGEGPATFDLTWYLGVNCDRLPESKEAATDHYRAALESHGIDTAPWWDEQFLLTALGTFLQLGWSKTDGDPAELAWWAERSAAALRLLD
jgi:hypothetical protein